MVENNPPGDFIVQQNRDYEPSCLFRWCFGVGLDGNSADHDSFLSTKSPRISGTSNGGTDPYKAIFGVGVPLHKPYIQLI